MRALRVDCEDVAVAGRGDTNRNERCWRRVDECRYYRMMLWRFRVMMILRNTVGQGVMNKGLC